MMRFSRLITLSLMVLSAASCVTTTPQSKREQSVEKAVDTPTSWASQYARTAEIQTRWLESFNDPVML